MFSFPWSNFHELNLDWILSVVKEAKDIFVRGEGDIQHAVETADQALETAEQAAAGVIADGSVTIPKVNDDVFNLMAFIVSGSVNPVAIPAGSLVILRKSTVYNVNDGIYVAASDIPASSILTAADLLQPSPLPDAGGLNYVLAQIGDTDVAVDAIQRGLVTVVDGDTATSAVPVGALAYLKNNTHNLQEGLYANISNAPFPTTGGTADATVFSAVPNVLNTIRDITGDGVLTDFTATDLTGAANELKTALNQLDVDKAETDASNITSASTWRSALELLYVANDVLVISASCVINGFFQSSTQAYFEFPVDKSMENISTVSVTTLSGSLYGVGGLVDSSNADFTASPYTASASKQGTHNIRIGIKKTTAFTNATTSAPACLFAQISLKFT